MERQEFFVIQVKAAAEGKQIVGEGGLKKGNAYTDVIQNHFLNPSPGEDETVKTRMRFAPYTAKRFQIIGRKITGGYSSAVDDETVEPLFQFLMDKSVKMRLHGDIRIGVNKILSIGMFVGRV